MTPDTANVHELSAPEKRALLARMLRERSARAQDSFHPLSYMQRTLWAHYQLVPESAAYSIPVVTRLRNRLDAAALRRAMHALTVRHPMLRTTYTVREGKPTQHIHATLAAEFAVHDTTGKSEALLMGEMELEIQRPFDLEHGPMLRGAVYTRGPMEHVVLLVVHHIALDFWSLEILIDELPILYAAELRGTSPALPALTLDYTDFVAWQREMIAGPEGERLWNYWKTALSGSLPLPDLPTDSPRPPLQTYRGFTHFFKLDDDLTQRLTTLSRSESATLYVTLLTAFEVMLFRYGGREEMLVGAPTAGRNRPGYENVVGCFVEGAMLKTDLSGDPTFRELLHRVRNKVREALSHQDYPASLLIEKLGVPWDPSRSPMSQIMFGWDKPLRLADRERSKAAERDGWIGFEEVLHETFALAHRTTMFDLLLIGIDLGPSLYVLLQGNVTLFRSETLLRMAGHFQTLLEAAAHNPDQKIREMPLLTAAEVAVMESWNATSADFPKVCVHRLFEAQVNATPDTVAVEFERTKLTYRELNERANRLAHALRTRGVGLEVPVAIFLDRSPEMIVAWLAVHKAGGAYVPLDPANPAERLASVLEDSRATVVLTERSLAARLPTNAAEVVVLDAEAARFEAESAENLDVDPDPSNLAYIIFTSGTTGRPKGVAIEHRGLTNHAHWEREALRLGPGERVLQFASFAFDTSVWEIVTTLISGATLCLARRDDLLPGEPLAALLKRERITLSTLPPAVLSVLPDGDYPDLKTIISAGDACSPRVVERWSRGRRLLNAYGPTEATITSTLAELVPSDREPPIGRPIKNARIHILDRNLQRVPIGVPGELYIAGVGVSRGYLRDAELTARKFVPDVFGAPGERMYRTGDLARYLPDGTIEYLGRGDHQIKLRGYRIEPGEIEAVLCKVPGVREALVTAREDAAEDKRLVAYIVPDGPRPPEIGALRQALKRSVPVYMAPSAFVMLDALPRTSLGKIDREALPRPDREASRRRGAPQRHATIRGFDVDLTEIESVLRAHSAVNDCAVAAFHDGTEEERLFAYVVPRGERAPMTSELKTFLEKKLPDYKVPSGVILLEALPLTASGERDLEALPLPEWALGLAQGKAPAARSAIEERLSTIFAQVLDVEGVELHDSFFDLGGYSFLAAELIYRVRQEFGVHLVLSSLFETPTVASLARVVAAGRDHSASQIVVLDEKGSKAPLFCLHPAGGQVLLYRHLAALLTIDRPILGIQSRALVDAQAEHESMEAMAAQYADLIRLRQPEGPYHLLGHSMGGLLAVAVADVLERDGREVAFVGLLDSFLLAVDGKLPVFESLDFMPDLAQSGAQMSPAFASMGAMFADLDRATQDSLMQDLVSPDSSEKFDHMMRWLEEMKIPMPLSREALAEYLRLFQIHVRLLGGYRPPVIRAPLFVWWAANNPSQAAATRADWNAHTTGGVREGTALGNHYTMILPPHIEELAPKLNHVLNAIARA